VALAGAFQMALPCQGGRGGRADNSAQGQ